MPRDISGDFREELEASRSGEILVVFAVITHKNLLVPLRVNSDVINYVYQGETYFGAAFEITPLSDDENLPRAQVSINNVDQRIGEAIRALRTSPRIDIMLFAASDFTDANPRVEIGTPTIEYRAPYLELRNVTCDHVQLTGELQGKDISTTPYPSIRSTQDRLPGLTR